MTKRYWALCTAIILMTGILQFTYAEEQTFSISRSLDLYNEDPCIAMNKKTGDILAVWFRVDENNRSNSKIYSALCKLKGDGSFKVGKARLISGSNDTCSDPYVAHSPESNSFLVVWRIDRSIANSHYIDTQARAVSAKGRIVGKIVELLPTKGRFEHSAVLAPVTQSVRKTSPNAVFLMSWQLTPQVVGEFETHAGLWTVFLDEKGKEVSAPKRIMKMQYKFNPYDTGETKPYRVITTEKVAFYLTTSFIKLKGDDRIQETYVLKLDNKGDYDGKVLLDSGKTPIDTRIAVVSKKRLLAGWYNFNEGKCYNQLLKPTLKKIKVSYPPVSGTSSTPELVGLEDGGAFQIIATFPGFHTARFNAKGKMEGSPTYHDSIPYLTKDMMAVQIPGTSKVLMVWRRVKAANSAEIAGTFFEMN